MKKQLSLSFLKVFAPIKYPLLLYFSWRSLIILYQIFIQPYYKITNESLTIYQRIYFSWVNYWDSGHYLNIALTGYKYPQQAFFPLWPTILKLFSFLGVPLEPIAYILSFSFGLLTFILFYLLASKLIGATKAKSALLCFCVFPSTMFLIASYTEALFLMLTLFSFILLEKKRLFFSALFGNFALTTRVAGIGIPISFLCLNQPLRKKIIYVLICLLGLILYMFYLQKEFNNPFLFSSAQKEWCQSQGRCQFTFPLDPLISYGRLVFMGWIKPSLSSHFIDWSSAVIFLLLSIKVLKYLKFNYFTYSLTVILLSLSYGTTVGMVRYVLVAFPVFFIIPLIIHSKILLYIIYLLLFLLQLRFIALFTSSIWVG